MLIQADLHDESGIFTTRNSKYYLRRGRCVGVWSRRDGTWRPHHAALGHRLAGVFPLLPSAQRPELAQLLGRRLLFENDVLSSPLIDAERTSDPLDAEPSWDPAVHRAG